MSDTPIYLEPGGGVWRPGTISHGTLRSEDLFVSLSDELERLMPVGMRERVALARADMLVATDDAMSELVNDLSDTLSEIAPEGWFFGAHMGDGSDFGFWSVDLDEDWIE